MPDFSKLFLLAGSAAGTTCSRHSICPRSRIEQLRLLSKLEQSGLLSVLEKQGVTLSKLEQSGWVQGHVLVSVAASG